MVLILSEKKDFSTFEVIDWLNYYSTSYLLITKQDKISLKWKVSDILIIKDGIEYPLSKFKSFWYRRGYLDVEFFESNISELNQFLKIEQKKLIEFLYFKLSKLNTINTIGRSDVNKLIISTLAREIGLKTPKDHIISEKKELIKLKAGKNLFSTKSISGHAIYNFSHFSAFFYTSLLDFKRIKNKINTESFFPSYIQTYIEKKFELRIFFLNNTFYSMAIFSQNDKKTKIDFRNYNREKPNRTVPFSLPKYIKNKLIKLMNKIKINCGSIDMIVNQNNDYIFLELNPIGQFGMVSKPCNYNIEREIALQLITNYNE